LALGAGTAGARPDGRLQVLSPRGPRSDPLRQRALAGIRLPGRADVPRRARGVSHRGGADRLPRSPAGTEQDVLADRRRGDVARAAVALQVAAGGLAPASLRRRHRAGFSRARGRPMLKWMDSSAYAFTYGIRHTRETLREWNWHPLRVLGRWSAGAAFAAVALLTAVWVIASLSGAHEQIVQLRPPFAVGRTDDVLGVLFRNSLVLALHAMACVAGFIAGSSLPQSAAQRSGLSRLVHAKAGPLAIGFVVCATTFSLITQAYVLGGGVSTVAAELGISHGLLLLALLPHALPELVALFLPLAAWLIASRSGE